MALGPQFANLCSREAPQFLPPSFKQAMLGVVTEVTLKSSCLTVPGMLNLWTHRRTWRQEGRGLPN